MQQWRLALQDQWVNRFSHTLHQSRQQVESDNNKSPVGLIDIVRILLKGRVLLKSGVDDVQASLVDRGCVSSKALRGGN